MKKLLIIFAIFALMAADADAVKRHVYSTGIAGDTLAAPDTLWSNVINIKYANVAFIASYDSCGSNGGKVLINHYWSGGSTWGSGIWYGYDPAVGGALPSIQIDMTTANEAAQIAILGKVSVIGMPKTTVNRPVTTSFGRYLKFRLINTDTADSLFNVTIKVVSWE